MSRYTYSCAECGGSVTKKATGQKLGKGSEITGLGGWGCQVCGKGIRVVRKMNKN